MKHIIKQTHYLTSDTWDIIYWDDEENCVKYLKGIPIIRK